MPLEILGPLVIVGIALIVLVVRFSGISKRLKISSNAHAQELLNAEYSEYQFSDPLFLSVDGAAAIGILQFVEDKSQPTIGLVLAMGDRFVVRALHRDQLRVSSLGANHVLLKPVEFGMGATKTRFANAQEVEAILALVNSD